jgi:Tol biopolymer transport system component
MDASTWLGGSMKTRSAVAAIGALAAALTAVSPALATFPGENGKLAFEREREGGGDTTDLDVFTMNPDGTDQTRLNTDETHDTRPDWSPDGHRIVVSSRLAAIPPTEARPRRIFVMHGDGTCRTQLTDGLYDTRPIWSPDARKIAFLRPTGTFRASDIFVMNADGSGETQVTDHKSRMASAAWSPDGGRFAFTATTQSGQIPFDWRIFVVNADGTNATEIAPGGDPNWSPDARYIASTGVFVMNTDGTHMTLIKAGGSGPVWSPDGSKIAFTSSRDGDAEIFVMNADGSDETQLTHNAVDDFVTSWQARPTSPPPSCAPPDTTGPRVTIVRETIRASRRGAVSIRVGCPADEPAGCNGRLSLRTASRVRVTPRRRRTVTLGTASFRIPAGRTAPVTVRLSRANRRLLARLRRVRVAASVRAVDQAGHAGTARATLLLKAPRRR